MHLAELRAPWQGRQSEWSCTGRAHRSPPRVSDATSAGGSLTTVWGVSVLCVCLDVSISHCALTTLHLPRIKHQ